MSPYVLSLAVYPALLAPTNVPNLWRPREEPPYVRLALSEVGRFLDEALQSRQMEVNALVARSVESSREDVVMALRPEGVRRHRGRVVGRDRKLQMPEQPADYEHLL